jgi:hypothetical protein
MDLSKPGPAALIGVLSTLPFVVTALIVSLRIEPLYSFLGSFPSIRNSPLLPLLLLLFVPVGAFIALRPALARGADGRRSWHLPNVALVAVLLAGFVMVFVGLGEDFYRCEILRIPNCD